MGTMQEALILIFTPNPAGKGGDQFLEGMLEHAISYRASFDQTALQVPFPGLLVKTQEVKRVRSFKI
jgi:hypothetical protein